MSTQVDYFTLFELPRRYPLDREALEAAYERLTMAHHPDFFTTADEAERQEAARMSARVNEGYRVLRDDLSRAGHLLALLAADRDLDKTALPDGFLQEMFLLQEELEELGAPAEDSEQDAARRADLRAQVQEALAAAHGDREARFAEALDGTADGGAAAETLQALQTNLNRERYLRRLLDRLDGKDAD